MYNQVIPKEEFEEYVKYDNRFEYHPLIYNSSTNEYYLDKGDLKLIYEAGINQEITAFLNKLQSLGYKTSDSKGDFIIHTNNGKLSLTADIVDEVNKGNNKYLEEISISVKTFNDLAQQSKPLMESLAKHFSSYQYATLTTDRLNVWKQDVLKADELNKKVNSLKGREKENIYNFQKHLDYHLIGEYNDFRDVLIASKKILGL